MTESVTQALTDRFKERRRKDMQEEAFRANYEGPIATQATPTRAEVIGDYFGNFLQKLGLGAASANEMNRRTTKAAGFSGVLNSMDAIDKGNYGEAAENLVGGPGGGMLESMFIGAGAKNAPSLFLKPAMEDLNAGVPKKKVWEDWGWFAGKDGAMKTEISDRTADLNMDAGEWPRRVQGAPFKPKEEARLPTAGGNYDPGQLGLDMATPPLSAPNNFGTLFKHDNLFEAYPEVGLADYQARSAAPGQYSGVYYKPDEDSPHGTIKATGPRPTPEGFKKEPKDVVGVSLHEAQHAIQDIEGWGRGGNPQESGLRNQGLSMKLRARDELKQMEEDGVDAADPRYQQLVRIASTRETSGGNEVPYLGYLSLAGETEARNVQTRRDFTGPERRAKAPWETEDIPGDYQLYRSQDHPFKGEDELIGQNVLRGQADQGPPTRDDLAQAKVERPEQERSGVFDYGANYPYRDLGIERFRPKKVPERTSELLARPEVYDEWLKGVQRGEPVKDWYETGPLRKSFEDLLGTSAGLSKFDQFIDSVAATSPRSDVGTNVRNASYYYGKAQPFKGRNSLPSIDDLPEKNPFPYGHLAQNLHRMNAAKTVFPGGEGLDFKQNPKPIAFAANLKGDPSVATIDTHAFRAPAMMGADPRFLATSFKPEKDVAPRNIQKELASGDVSMEEALGRGAWWESKPRPTEYAAFEDFYKRGGRDLGMTPAETQAAAWVGHGPTTGLESAPKSFMDFVEERILKTARERGMDPKEVWRAVVSGKTPLLGIGGAGLGAATLAGGQKDDDT